MLETAKPKRSDPGVEEAGVDVAVYRSFHGEVWIFSGPDRGVNANEKENENEKGPREGNPEAARISRLESGVHPRLAISILYSEARGVSSSAGGKKAGLSHEINHPRLHVWILLASVNLIQRS